MTVQQLDLTDYRDVCQNRHGGNPESVAAHAKIARTKEDARFKVLFQIEKAGAFGRTIDEVSVILGTTPNAVSPRFSELKRDGLILKIGTRPTRSGCKAGVYRSV